MSERAESVPAACWELTKPRLSALSSLTALAGYFCSDPDGAADARTLVSLALGTALAAGACGALNMWWDREADARMERTRGRPIPAGTVTPGAALAFGLTLLAAGVGLVWFGADSLAGALTAGTAASYLLLYTPLKSRTSWCTLVGSLPGALPPLIGTAAKLGGRIDEMGWMLFALLFFWQVPHFMALAMLWREDYARGGFRMATVEDPAGGSAARWAAVFTVPMVATAGLISTTFSPVWSSPYWWVSTAAGLWFLKLTSDFLRPDRREAAAKPYFIASILYLPAVLLTLTLCRLF
ncbi:MAG: heme o synthase [Verrucomicrobiota bacterium]